MEFTGDIFPEGKEGPWDAGAEMLEPAPSRRWLNSRQRDDHGRQIPLEEGADCKGNGQGEEKPASPGKGGLPLGEIDQQGAAAAEVEKKDVEPLEIEGGRRHQMMEKATDQGRGHHDKQHGLHFPAHRRVSPRVVRFFRAACARPVSSDAWRKVYPDRSQLFGGRPGNRRVIPRTAIWP